MAALALLGALQTSPLPPNIDVFAALWVWICFAAIASLIIFLFVAIWLYRDAESRGMAGGLWVVILLLASFLFTFAGGVLVLVIYLVVRMEHPVGAVPAGSGYGYPPPYPPPPPAPPVAPATVAPTTCKSCGAPAASGAAFCANCGSKL